MLVTNTVKRFGSLKFAKTLRKNHVLGREFSNFRGTYKSVYRLAEPSDGIETNSNWELLSPEGSAVRFFLPGSVGPAGLDNVSLSFMTSSVPTLNLPDFKLEADECPVLLRSGLSDLFATPEVVGSNTITILKILFKKALPTSSEQDMEKLSKQFVCIAEDICESLKGSGYWADFINPFSGAARYSLGHPLYGDDAMSCLNSTMVDNGPCKVIFNGYINRSRHIGNLYTNAPKTATAIVDLLNASKT